MKPSQLIDAYGPIVLAGLIESETAKAEQLHAAGLGPPVDEHPTVLNLKRYGSDVLQALGALAQDAEDKKTTGRIAFTADLASRFCQTIVETTEGEEELRTAARRAVALASFVIDEAEKSIRRVKA